MIYVFLADGFEEVEALAPVDLLRRAGLSVQTVGVTGKVVTGSHGIAVAADILPEAVVLDEAVEAVVLPGGMPGASNLDASPAVQAAVDFAAQNGKLVCAICAAPFILGKKGLLSGKRATCFPGFEAQLTGARVTGDFVTCDGQFITAKGMGAAVDFGLAVVATLCGEEAAAQLRETIQAP